MIRLVRWSTPLETLSEKFVQRLPVSKPILDSVRMGAGRIVLDDLSLDLARFNAGADLLDLVLDRVKGFARPARRLWRVRLEEVESRQMGASRSPH